MKVYELVDLFKSVNPDAEIRLNVHNYEYGIELYHVDFENLSIYDDSVNLTLSGFDSLSAKDLES